MPSLNRSTVNTPGPRPARVLQFGSGNFLRGFTDWMIQMLNEQTNFNGDIIIVKPTKGGNYETLRSQDGLFNVILQGSASGQPLEEFKLIQCVQKIINPYTEWDEYLKSAEIDTLRIIISNTTEAGIKFNPEDTFNSAPPIEFPAKLTLWLYHRFQFFENPDDKGCIVLPCELVPANGDLLKDVILQYARLWELGIDFIKWINTANHFCNTLVDRIISGYPTDKAFHCNKELGYEDRLLVTGEYYHSWVIETGEPLHELPFEETDLNVTLVPNLKPFREMKVRILNGAHTTMVPVGLLAGMETVKDCTENDIIFNFVESFLKQEVADTLSSTDAVKVKYINEILSRFKNPALQHKLYAISLNSTSKFTARLLPTLKDYLEKEKKLPVRLVLGFSALIVLYKGEEIDLKDESNVLSFFKDNWKGVKRNSHDIQTMVVTILGNSSLWGEDLSKIPGFAEMVTDYVYQIENNGILSTLKAIK